MRKPFAEMERQDEMFFMAVSLKAGMGDSECGALVQSLKDNGIAVLPVDSVAFNIV